MDWSYKLMPPHLDRYLAMMGLTDRDHAELKARWLMLLADQSRLFALARLYEQYFLKGEDPRGCDPVDAVFLCLIHLPVLEMTYQQLSMDETVLRDTVSDIGRWMDKERRTRGCFGLSELHWVMHGLCMELVQLGSLQFMPTPGRIPVHAYQGPWGPVLLAEDGLRYRADGWGAQAQGLEEEVPTFTTVFDRRRAGILGHLLDAQGRVHPRPVLLPRRLYRSLYHPGDPIAQVHIPQGADISPSAVIGSLRRALAFDRPPFTAPIRAFTCHSWMLSPQLEGMLPGSRLAAFSALWHRAAPERSGPDQFWERAFDFRPVTPGTAPRDTRLQRALLEHRGPLLDSAGLLFPHEIPPEPKEGDES